MGEIGMRAIPRTIAVTIAVTVIVARLPALPAAAPARSRQYCWNGTTDLFVSIISGV